MQQGQWEELCEAMLKTGKFIESRTRPALLKRQDELGLSTLCVIEQHIVGHITRWQTQIADVEEVGSAFVVEKLQGKGLMRNMLETNLCEVSSSIMHFAFSDNPAFRKAALGIGFRIVDARFHQFDVSAWAHRLGIYQRLPSSIRCPTTPSEGQRCLFVR